MKKWINRALIAAAVIAVVSFALVRFFDREPEYEGRPLSKWMADLRTGRPAVQERAVKALNAMGPEAIAHLSGELTKPPTPVQRAAGVVSQYVPNVLKGPLRRIYTPSSDIVKKYAALNAIKAMGTNGASAVPALNQVLRDSNVGLSSAAATALGELGATAIPMLMVALDDGDYNIRSAACHALAAQHTNSAPAVPRLERIARDEIGPIASSAFHALSRIGETSVPALSNLVVSTNATVRSQAIYSLGVIGPMAKSTVSDLVHAVADPVPDVRWRAVEALWRIDTGSPDVVGAYVMALDDPNPNVRASAANALGFRRREVSTHFKRFCELLEDSSPGVRAQAAFAVGQTAELGTNAIPFLERLISDTNGMVKVNAVRALETILNAMNQTTGRSPPAE